MKYSGPCKSWSPLSIPPSLDHVNPGTFYIPPSLDHINSEAFLFTLSLDHINPEALYLLPPWINHVNPGAFYILPSLDYINSGIFYLSLSGSHKSWSYLSLPLSSQIFVMLQQTSQLSVGHIPHSWCNTLFHLFPDLTSTNL